jgi:Rha family phage regulatory protein
MKNVPSTIDGIEFNVNGYVKVSSLSVADKFNKRHSDVLRAIKNLECSDNFNERNIALVKYTDKKGESRDSYTLTRDGFMFLAMGFKGKEAAAWKEDVIAAFNKMEQYIIDEEARRRERAAAAMTAPDMTDALLEHRKEQDKDTKPFHYSNEFNMISRIVLGATAKKWREHVGLDKKDDFRDALTPVQIEATLNLQTANTVLIEMGMEYKERQAKLNKLYNKKYAKRCLDEIVMLNA